MKRSRSVTALPACCTCEEPEAWDDGAPCPDEPFDWVALSEMGRDFTVRPPTCTLACPMVMLPDLRAERM